MITLIINRLESAPSPFVQVLASESLDALVADVGQADDGAVVVVPWRERARPNRNATPVLRQLVEVQFVVAMVSRRHDDPRGGAKAVGFDEIKARVEARLAGWPPESGATGCTLIGGESTGLGNGVSIFAQTWQTSRFLTGVES